MGGGGGGFQAKKEDAYQAGSIASLTSSIKDDKGIDEESKAELIRGLSEKTRQGGRGAFMAGTDFRAISANVDKAREGTDPLYATRRLFQNRRQSIISQPGRAQTVLTR